MRKDTQPIFDGEFCSEWPQKPCPFLAYEKQCDTMCSRYEKAPHPVQDERPQNYLSWRLSRCPQCKADFGGAS